MDLDRVGEVWRREAGGAPAGSPAEEIEAVRARASELEWIVRRRDRLETGVSLAILPVFAWVAIETPHALSAVGAAILALTCAFIPIRLRMARRRGPDPALPVVLALQAELSRVRAQQRLLGDVAWWYLTPLGTGVILFMAGAAVSPLYKTGFAATVVALYGWLLYRNLAVRRDLQPLARELEDWLTSFDKPSLDGASDVS